MATLHILHDALKRIQNTYWKYVNILIGLLLLSMLWILICKKSIYNFGWLCAQLDWLPCPWHCNCISYISCVEKFHAQQRSEILIRGFTSIIFLNKIINLLISFPPFMPHPQSTNAYQNWKIVRNRIMITQPSIKLH